MTWKKDKYRHQLASRGIKSGSKSHYNEMIEDEKDGYMHYLEMRDHYKEINPAYADLYELMAQEEYKHQKLLANMKEGKKIDYRDYTKVTAKDILDSLEQHKVITNTQKRMGYNFVDNSVKKMPKEKLKASGVATSLVMAFLSPMFGKMGENMITGISGESKSSKA